MADARWGREIHSFYHTQPYWEGEIARTDHDRRETAGSGFGRKLRPHEAGRAEQLFRQNNFDLIQAARKAEHRTGGNAIGACTKVVMAGHFEQDRSGRRSQFDTDRDFDRDNTRREKDEFSNQDFGDSNRSWDRQTGEAGRTHRVSGNEKIMVEVVCLVEKDGGAREFKAVLVNPETGETSKIRNLDQMRVEPYFTRVASAD
jgi:hypothetical protein